MSTQLGRLAPGQERVDLRNTRNANDIDIFTSHHDMPTTAASVQELLAGGTPDWVKRPEEYKNYAREAMQAEREISLDMVERYQMDDQEELTDAKARMVKPMSTEAFINKLRKNSVQPVKCFTVYNGLEGTVGLWCIPPKVTGRARYVCYLRTPMMYEWSVLKLDNHNLPAGELRGWRTPIMELIKKEILTEWQAHQIFGEPSGNKIFRRYRRSLWEFRNRKRETSSEIAAKDIQA